MGSLFKFLSAFKFKNKFLIDGFFAVKIMKNE